MRGCIIRSFPPRAKAARFVGAVKLWHAQPGGRYRHFALPLTSVLSSAAIAHMTTIAGVYTVISRSLLPFSVERTVPPSEKDAKLAQTLGQLQPFVAAFPQECTGQIASFGPT
jgi:hypothetical protein